MATYKESFSLHLQDNYSQQINRFVEKLRELNKYADSFNAGLKTTSSNLNNINTGLSTTLNKMNSLSKEKIMINPDLDTTRVENKFKSLREKMRVSFGDMMGTIATAGIVLAPLKQSMAIEKKYYSIQKTLPDEFQSGNQRASLEKIIREGAVAFSLPMEQAYDVFARMAQSTKSIYEVDGKVDIGKLKELAEISMKTASSFDISGEAAGTFVANMSNLLQQSQKVSGIDPIENLKLWTDTINAAGNIMSSQAVDIKNVAARVGGTFASQGWSAAGTTALISTLLSAGTEPERAATALMNVTGLITKMGSAKPPKELLAGLQALGLNARELNKIFVKQGPEAVFDLYVSGIAKNKTRIIDIDKEINAKRSNGTLTATYENKLLGEKETLLRKNSTAQNAIANDSTLEGVNVAKLIDMEQERLRLKNEALTAEKVRGSLDKEALGALQLQSAKYQSLKTAITGLFVGIGETGNISKLLETLTSITLKITEWVKAHPELVGNIGKVVASLLTLKIATMGLKFAFGGVLDMMGLGNNALKMLGFLVGSPAIMAGFASMIGMGGLGGVNAGLLATTTSAHLLRGALLSVIATTAAWKVGDWIGKKVEGLIFDDDTKKSKERNAVIDKLLLKKDRTGAEEMQLREAITGKGGRYENKKIGIVKGYEKFQEKFGRDYNTLPKGVTESPTNKVDFLKDSMKLDGNVKVLVEMRGDGFKNTSVSMSTDNSMIKPAFRSPEINFGARE